MVGVASLALGGIQTVAGLIQNATKDKPEQYEETAEMKAARARAREMAKRGFTAEEEAAFRQSSAATGNTQFRRGVDMGGGNLAAALRASINANQLNANNQHAAQGAQIMRQNIGMSNSLEQGYQGLQNSIVDQQRQVAAQQAQAASQSINSGITGIGNALNLQQALKYNATLPNGQQSPINITNATAPTASVNYTTSQPNLGTSGYYGNQQPTLGGGGLGGWYDANGYFHSY